jgi:hypothetical protein
MAHESLDVETELTAGVLAAAAAPAVAADIHPHTRRPTARAGARTRGFDGERRRSRDLTN